jgi:hypothetical protein
MTEQRTHDKRSPSSLPRLKACPGSYFNSIGKKQTYRDSSDSDRGTNLHEIVEEVWAGKFGRYDGLPDHDQRCIDYVIESMHRFDARKGTWHFEQRLELYDSHTGEFVTSGYVDAFKILLDGTAILLDFKMGFLAVDDPIENWQLAPYAAMIMQVYGALAVESHIIQPYHYYEPYTWTDEVAITDSVKALFAASEKIDAPLRAGKHCTYCPAQESCEVFDEWTAKAENTDLATLAPEDALQVKQALSLRAKHIDSRIEGLKAITRANGGQFGQLGFKRERGRVEVDIMKVFGQVKDIIPHDQFLGMCSVRLGDKGVGETKELGLKSTLAKHAKATGQVKALKDYDAIFEEMDGVTRGPDVEKFVELKG